MEAEWKIGDSDLFGVRNSGFRCEMIEMRAFLADFRGIAQGLHGGLREDARNGTGCHLPDERHRRGGRRPEGAETAECQGKRQEEDQSGKRAELADE